MSVAARRRHTLVPLALIVTVFAAAAFISPWPSSTRSRLARPALLEEMKVRELKDKCRELGLPVSGKKAQLVERLEAALEASRGDEHETVDEPTGASAEEPAILQEQDLGREEELPRTVEEPVSASPKEPEFLPGDQVVAFHGEDNAYEAIVQRDECNGRFLLTSREDGHEHTCPAEKLKLLKRLPKVPKFIVGEAVEGLYNEEQRWHPARVKCVSESGRYTVIWDEDEEEYELDEAGMRQPTRKIPLEDLSPGQQLRGRVRQTFGFGTFVDVGAVMDGLVSPFHMHQGEEPVIKLGDKVSAKYDDEEDPYDAVVQKDFGNGTYQIVWDEDGEEYTCKKEDMELLCVKELEEDAEVDVFVDSVTTPRDGKRTLRLSLVKSKVGKRPKLKKAEQSRSFESVASDTWLEGQVKKILSFGAIVSVTPPTGGPTVDGMLHITQVREGIIENLEEELEEGQQVKVRILSMDKAGTRLSLSMKA